MMVLSREIGQSVIIKAPEGECLVTVVQIDHRDNSALILVTQASPFQPGCLASQSIKLKRSRSFRVGTSVHVTLIELRHDKVRLGFIVPPDIPIDRMELRQTEDILEPDEPPFRLPGSEEDEDDGGAPAPVPRPSSPKPPNLNVQQELPEANDN